MKFCKDGLKGKGFYWWRRSAQDRAEMLFYFGDDFPNVLLFERDESFPLSELVDWFPELEYAGPIPEPQESSEGRF